MRVLVLCLLATLSSIAAADDDEPDGLTRSVRLDLGVGPGYDIGALTGSIGTPAFQVDVGITAGAAGLGAHLMPRVGFAAGPGRMLLGAGISVTPFVWDDWPGDDWMAWANAEVSFTAPAGSGPWFMWASAGVSMMLVPEHDDSESLFHGRGSTGPIARFGFGRATP